MIARLSRLLPSRRPAPEPGPNPANLTQLARHFRSDKASQHSYTRHYQRHFRRFRMQPITLLEIGIGGYAREGRGGASLRMWKAHFPHAQIVGIDIEDKSFVDEERIRTFQGDQSDRAFLTKVIEEIGTPQIIIDDGSHVCEHVRTSFEILFPMLDHGGLYAIEDIQTSYWPEKGGSEDLAATHTSMAMVKSLLDSLNHEEFLDDDYAPTYTDRHIVGLHAYHNLVIIEKGHNDEGSNKRKVLKARYGRTRRSDAP